MYHIALTGLARSGKDSVASILTRDYAYSRLAFADKLKEAAVRIDPMIRTSYYAEDNCELSWLLSNFGGWERVKKEYPDSRRFLQDLGHTMRELDPYIWVHPVIEQVRSANTWGMPVVVTDVRYLNEVDTLRHHGAYVVRVNRPGAGLAGTAGAHDSETELSDLVPDYVINNNSDSLDTLAEQVRVMMGVLRLR